MNEIIAATQLILGLSDEECSEWRAVSKDTIASGEIEVSSEDGLVQSIDLLAWHFATDTFLVKTGTITDTEWRERVDHKTPIIDDIMEVMALSSGVHPSIIDLLVKNRSQDYMQSYIDQELNYV